MNDIDALTATAADIETRAAQLAAAQSAAAQEESELIASLGVATADNDGARIGSLEKRLNDTRTTLQRLGAALPVLLQRRQQTAAQLAAQSLADARRQFDANELEAIVKRRAAVEAAEAFMAAMNELMDVARRNELLMATWGNSLERSAHYSSFRIPTWSLEGWIVANHEMLATVQ